MATRGISSAPQGPRRTRFTRFVVSLICLNCSSTLFAHPGALDTGFGTNGKLVTELGYFDWYYAVVIQADGKLVASGGPPFALARFNSDGSLDTSFGDGGRVSTNLGDGSLTGTALALQSDGKIVVVGYGTSASLTSQAIALARYEVNGSLDTTFGTAGLVLFDAVPWSPERANAVAIQNDGKIVVAGSVSFSSTENFFVARFNSDGTADSSFGGGNGWVYTDVASSISDAAFTVALQPDGRILVGGGGTTMDFVGCTLIRYNADGSLDATFGGGVVVNTNFGGTEEIALQPDGKILVATTSASNFALLRYNGDGSLDAAFGTDGLVTADFGGYEIARAVAVQSDGRIIVGGTTSSYGDAFALARFNSDGSLDTDFDCDGVVTTDLGGQDSVRSLAIQSDGKIVAAGNSGINLAIARYLVAGPPQCPDVAVNKSASATGVKPRKTLTYTITATNHGPGDAVGVTVTDALPSELILLSAEVSQGNYNVQGNAITCNLGVVPTGSNAVINLVVKVMASRNSFVTNAAVVTTETYDPISANDSASTVTEVTNHIK